MLPYRLKDEVELAWRRTCRQILRGVDLRLADFKDELINDLKAEAWVRFSSALQDGDLVEFEGIGRQWVDEEIRKFFTEA